MSAFMRILASLSSVYMFVVFLRVMLSWFDSRLLGRPYELMERVTDPYLGYFRRFAVLRTSTFDFSPVVALAVLALVNNILTTIATYGRISLAIILSMIVSGAWSAVAFILIFFVIVLLLRLILSSQRPTSLIAFRQVLESLSEPVLRSVNRLIYRERYISYQRALITAFIGLLVLRLAGGAVVRLVIGLLLRLPF